MERLERLHNIVDTNNDCQIDVTELADLGFLMEDMEYITHEETAEFARWCLDLHHYYGKSIFFW